MISHVVGILGAKDLDRVEVFTTGGVGYELQIPLSVFESLPKQGETVALHTHLVVKEDGWALYGFSTRYERRVFQRVLAAKGVGPALALGLLSTLTAERLVRAIREKDIATLQSVPRVGRKKAEQLILDLADKIDDVPTDLATSALRPEAGAADDAVRGLISLGYPTLEAEKMVRIAIDTGARGRGAPELIRAALSKAGGR